MAPKRSQMTVPRPMTTDTYRNVIMVIISRSWSRFM